MATRQEMTDFEADKQDITCANIAEAAAIAIKWFDLDPRDLVYFSGLLNASNIERLNYMMHDRRGRFLWIHGGEKMLLSFLSSEWGKSRPCLPRLPGN